ncbi:hypothetical protein ACC691_38650, partial [Rhizobium johnstonii]|uniref:hypothetical protein n=1 Tax=Rhizobium johnstonii TaxID=3019933 RepID=UPI003F99AA62
DWYREGRQQYSRRELRLRGTLAPGSRITAGAQAGPYLVYDDPVLYPNARTDAGARSAKQVRVLGVGDDGSLLVEEVLSAGQPEHRQTPLALT